MERGGREKWEMGKWRKGEREKVEEGQRRRGAEGIEDQMKNNSKCD